jgi:hypothetical protein
MKSAAKSTISTFGVIAGVAGFEHGLGEVLQGNIAPAGIAFESWPDAEFFRIMAGEPAMSLIPNLLISGVLTILVAVIFIVWAVGFIDRKHGGLVLLGLTIVLLLVGGGFGPPLMGVILSIAAIRMNSIHHRWTAQPASGLYGLLSQAWPWLYGAAIFTWLLLLPGTNLLSYFFGIGLESYVLIPAITFSAFSLLVLALWSGFVRDRAESRKPTSKPVAINPI